MPRDYDNRNKKKSWSEIDKMKDKSHHHGSGDSYKESKEAKQQKSREYKTYKNDLENVFSGGEIPKYLKDAIPISKEKAGQLKLLGNIKRSTDDKSLKKAVKEYLKKHKQFPEDYDLLLRMLEYPDEAVQLQVVEMLDKLSAVEPLKHRQQFILKLESIAMLGEDDDLLELAEELISRFR